MMNDNRQAIDSLIIEFTGRTKNLSCQNFLRVATLFLIQELTFNAPSLML